MAWVAPKTWTSAVLSSTEMNTHLRDNLLHLASTTGNLTLTTAGPHAIGGAVDPDVFLKVHGAFAGFTGLHVSNTLTADPNGDAHGLYVTPTLNEAASGTHDLFTSAIILAPAITAGAATLTQAATLYLFGVPTGATRTHALFINTIGDDGYHVGLSNDDVAHGVTDVALTNVYAQLGKASATEGGLLVQGLTEGATAVAVQGISGTTDTTAATGSNGAITLLADLKAGTTTGALAATDNTVVFKNHSNATHIFKGNGNSYEDGTGWTAYDDGDDVALIETLEYELTAAQGRPIQRQFSAWLAEHRALLERQQLATFATDGSIFVNRSGIQALLCGFARQATARIVALEQRLARLESA